MDNNLKYFRVFVMFILLANMVDAVSTYFLLQSGVAYEVTPWMNALIENYGLNAVLILKLSIALPLFLLGCLVKKPGKIVLYTAATGVSIYGLLLLWHFFLLIMTLFM